MMDVEFRDDEEEALKRAGGTRRAHHRRRSSMTRESATQEMVQLPMLRDVAANEHPNLFRLKLQMCRVRFNFDTNSNQIGKDLKRNTMLELIEYVNSDRGQRIFNEPGVMEDVVGMVSVNMFRALPPQMEGFDPEEDEPVLEASWPHLQVVYEFLLRFVISREVAAKVAKRKHVIDQTFCLKLVQIFDSEDPRERDYLKTILHRVYGKFMSHRAFIRRQLGYTFQRFAFDSQRHNGISELLEILGSIINGFALPLKAEHLRFLSTSLIPLHKTSSVSSYHNQLSYCICQYIEKDPNTLIPIVKGLAKHWPWSQASRQVLFLNELEDVLERAPQDLIPQALPYALKIVAKSIESEHFQVVERTLYLWNNEHISVHFFGRKNAEIVYPVLHKILQEKMKHWNATVKNLSDEVTRLCKSRSSPELWARLEEHTKNSEEIEEKRRRQREANWQAIKSRNLAAVDGNVPVMFLQAYTIQPSSTSLGTGAPGAASATASSSPTKGSAGAPKADSKPATSIAPPPSPPGSAPPSPIPMGESNHNIVDKALSRDPLKLDS
ncbi:Serine/threonine-protein phosphatase 2A 56 kDa regulatory subunit epsilon isoform [Hondaea fermentalgiana]|uniref:Serine/threonine-protein phosphatase 2A 56 kDa regulatory subunit epsilon isoform n=1 Tax=Hondaea fermentalgiana TaxID=2315210 RepID=A0A2R5G1P2_9STRA|nr:Serine/threonine-protein phosphatase 2A 56 kDa regulatory subunit epsilon isoform [Hondaea fermentalgiana]|eukprot:GBG24445.1 Serine/threonine-protein phosphatase 2A 56 kDa regulatory subunit epsilon isoform [Hondaea fermentalgiana]